MPSLLNFLKSLDLATWLAIAGIVIALIMPFITNKAKKPMFYLSEEVILASRSQSYNDLHIFWKEKEIVNARSIEISFFNKGKIPILKSDISSDSYIIAEYSEEVEDLQILQADIILKSRQELDLSMDIINEKIQIALNNDEAFEKDDGFKIRIIYTSKIRKPNWILRARIIGVKKGIKKSLSSPLPFYSWPPTVYPILVVFLALTHIPNYHIFLLIISILEIFFVGITTKLHIPMWVIYPTNLANKKRQRKEPSNG
ncbi:hypothetical protein TREAZ_1053 [Leadbettera azotonutricia ZAS-9]|uniref:Uncharacterized protein n=2 Tax=Leadbettera azotonutricia TaxID=150829 RepID=F5Y7M6_LEAAZ|nr:hypothetical protein TREAZ_1053 [Leadbettera azotonutricia ZAS-9]